MRYAVGQRILATFAIKSDRHAITYEGTILEEIIRDGYDNKYLVRLDVPSGRRDYVMGEDELTSIEELFG